VSLLLRLTRSRDLFWYSSWILVLAGIFMIFMLTPWFQRIQSVSGVDVSLRLMGGALGIAGALAMLILWFGMAIYCVREDRSRVGVKLLWFIFFFLAGPYGSVVYYFAVYRKRVWATAGSIKGDVK